MVSPLIGLFCSDKAGYKELELVLCWSLMAVEGMASAATLFRFLSGVVSVS